MNWRRAGLVAFGSLTLIPLAVAGAYFVLSHTLPAEPRGNGPPIDIVDHSPKGVERRGVYVDSWTQIVIAVADAGELKLSSPPVLDDFGHVPDIMKLRRHVSRDQAQAMIRQRDIELLVMIGFLLVEEHWPERLLDECLYFLWFDPREVPVGDATAFAHRIVREAQEVDSDRVVSAALRIFELPPVQDDTAIDFSALMTDTVLEDILTSNRFKSLPIVSRAGLVSSMRNRDLDLIPDAALRLEYDRYARIPGLPRGEFLLGAPLEHEQMTRALTDFVSNPPSDWMLRAVVRRHGARMSDEWVRQLDVTEEQRRVLLRMIDVHRDDMDLSP